MIYNNYHKMFWGFILILIDINIGAFDIFPNFIGYILIFISLNALNKEINYKAFSISSVLSVILLFGSLISLFFPINLLEETTIINMIVIIGSGIINLCMVYFILEGSVKLLKQWSKTKTADDIFKSQIKYVYIQLILLFLICFLINVNDNLSRILTIGIVLASLILNIWVVWLVNQIKKSFSNEMLNP